MSKIVPISSAFGKPAKRTRFFTIFSSGRLQYTEAGIAKFEERYKRWGFNIYSIVTSEDHFRILELCEDFELTDIIENGPELSDPSLTEEFVTDLLRSTDRKNRQSIREIVQIHNKKHEATPPHPEKEDR